MDKLMDNHLNHSFAELTGLYPVNNYSSENQDSTSITLEYEQSPPFQKIQPSQIPSECKSKQHTSAYTPIQKRKNLIIFDWDDIIFPTLSFRTLQHKKNKHFVSKLQILVTIIENIFTELIEMYGASNIIILTNASTDWIYTCLNIDFIQNTFMKFQKLLKTIPIISASTERARAKYPKNYVKWKEIAFMELFKKHFNSQDKHTTNCITSVGNSLCEYKATDYTSKYLNNRILNRILLKSNPSISDMIYQLREVRCIIDQFGINFTDIDIDYCSSHSSYPS